MVLPWYPAAVAVILTPLWPCTYTPQLEGTELSIRVAASEIVGTAEAGAVIVKLYVSVPSSDPPEEYVVTETVAVPEVAFGIAVSQVTGMVYETED